MKLICRSIGPVPVNIKNKATKFSLVVQLYMHFNFVYSFSSQLGRVCCTQEIIAINDYAPLIFKNLSEEMNQYSKY